MADYKTQCDYLKLYTAAVERYAETKKSYVTSTGQTIDKKYLAQCQKTICSFFKSGGKKTKSSGTSKKDVGFTKPFYFYETVVDYHGRILRETFPNVRFPSFEKFMPDGFTPNPLYRVLSHPVMTRVFSLTARITGQKKKNYYAGTEDFIRAHEQQIQRAREKDEEKGYSDYTVEEFQTISNTTKDFSTSKFNVHSYTHAHQSKIIQTSKDMSVEIIVDIFSDKAKESPGYQKKLDAINAKKDSGILLSTIQQRVSEVWGEDMVVILERQTADLEKLKKNVAGAIDEEPEEVEEPELDDTYSVQDLEGIEGSEESEEE